MIDLLNSFVHATEIETNLVGNLFFIIFEENEIDVFQLLEFSKTLNTINYEQEYISMFTKEQIENLIGSINIKLSCYSYQMKKSSIFNFINILQFLVEVVLRSFSLNKSINGKYRINFVDRLKEYESLNVNIKRDGESTKTYLFYPKRKPSISGLYVLNDTNILYVEFIGYNGLIVEGVEFTITRNIEELFMLCYRRIQIDLITCQILDVISKLETFVTSLRKLRYEFIIEDDNTITLGVNGRKYFETMVYIFDNLTQALNEIENKMVK